MNRALKVCLATSVLIASLALGQTAPFPLQKGIHVDMAVTHNAEMVPDADSPVAWIVTVTADGRLFFGTDPVTPERLADDMKTHPRDRGAKLYVKADARASFLDIEKVLSTGRLVYFEEAVLLTSQPVAGHPAGVASPAGIPVNLAAAPKQDPIVLQVAKATHQTLVLKINNQPVKESALQSTLGPLLRDRTDKTVVLKIGGRLSFAQVAQVLDACKSASAEIALQDSQP